MNGIHMIIKLKRAISTCIWANVLLTIVAGCQHYLSVAHAATYYVATTGNNSNPGTEEKPFLTIAFAIDTMVAGDTTYVRGGTYNEGLIHFKKTGTRSAQIKLLNYPDEAPTIHCIDPTALHRINFANGADYRLPIGWITVEGFEIRNCYAGFRYFNVHDSTFRRNWIHDNTTQGILGNGTRIVIDRNIINHNGAFVKKPSSTQTHGLYLNGTAIRITNNVIFDNLGYGIQQNGASSSWYDPSKHAGPEFTVSHNWIVANNTLAYNRNRAGMVVWGSTCLNALIENNIFYENAVSQTNSAPQGIDFVSVTCSGVQIRNNHFFASGSGGMAALGSMAIEGVHYMQSGNIVNVSDPAFVKAPAELPTSPNFSLTARSPAIDAGRSLDITKIAIDGTTRPQGRAYDMGAYEYTPDADAQSPKVPAELRVQ